MMGWFHVVLLFCFAPKPWLQIGIPMPPRMKTISRKISVKPPSAIDKGNMRQLLRQLFEHLQPVYLCVLRSLVIGTYATVELSQ